MIFLEKVLASSLNASVTFSSSSGVSSLIGARAPIASLAALIQLVRKENMI